MSSIQARPRLTVLSVSLSLLSIASAQVGVLTQHYNSARTGANLNETVLNTSNVNVNQFGKLFSQPVDASIYAQPLYVPNVNIPGKGVHNVVFVATMNDTVYAFDADQNTGVSATPLWSVNFTNPAEGITAVPSVDVQNPGNVDIVGPVGIESTPVIDAATGTIYVLARTKENEAYVQRLHALDITTGAEKPGGPTVIQATVSSVNGPVSFDPKGHNQRVALGLANGLIYLVWASHTDFGTYHGWVMAYSASTLQQAFVFNDAPDGNGKSGIWQSGQGPAIDSSGNAYLSTGNGTWDGSRNYGSSVVKLGPSLTVSDWFTPDNYSSMNAGDLDLASSGPMLLPNTNLLLAAGKQGIAYLVNTSSMGHLASGNGQIVQSFLAANGHVHGSPVYWVSPTRGPLVYIWSEFDYLKAFHFNGTTLDTTPVSQSALRVPDGMPGGFLSVTSNGSTAGTGVIWASTPLNSDAAVNPTAQGVVRAYDASDLTRELWDTQQNPARDDIGIFAKFVPPTVVNGKLYMASFSNSLSVYGLLPQNTDYSLSSLAPSQSVAPGSNISYTVTVSDLPSSVFRGTVTFSIGGLPVGATASFSPSSVTGNGSTMLTVSTATGLSQGTYPLTVNAASGSVNHSVGLTLNVNSAAIGVGPGLSGDVGSPAVAGSSSYSGGTYTVRGSGSDIWGTSDQFQYNYWQMTGDGTAIARIVSPANTSSYAKAGLMMRESLFANSSYAFISGLPSFYSFQYRNGTGARAASSPYLTPSYPMWVKLVRSNGNFTASASHDGIAWTQTGDAVSINMAATIFIGLAVTSNSPGTLGSATFDNVSYQPSSNPGADFSISANPVNQTVLVGNTSSYAVSTTGVHGFTGTINFSVSGLPAGTTAVFSPATLSGTGTTTLSISTTSGAAPGQYAGQIRATSGSLVRDQTVMLEIDNFSLSASPTSQSVLVGGATSFSISDNDIGYNGFANLSISSLPAGVTASFEPASVDRIVASTLSIQVAPSAAPGTYNLFVYGTSAGQVRQVAITLQVNGVPDYTIAVSPSVQVVPAGNSAAYTVTATASGGFSGVVNLGAAPLPPGSTGSFSPSSITGSGSSSFVVQTSGSTPPSSYIMTLTGTSGSTSHSAPAALTVWNDIDIGAPALGGGSSYSGGVFTVKGAGNDIFATSDQFDFNCWTMTGDGVVTARVTSITNTSMFAKAGVMMRESLSPSSSYAFAMNAPALRTFEYRTGTGNNSGWSGFVTSTLPAWVRLVRIGANITAYSSPDGTTWTQSGNTVSVPMASTIYAGLAVTSQNPGLLNTAAFDNVKFSSAPAATPDFTLTSSSTTTQSVPAGQNTSYSFAITAVNGFTGAVTLSATGLPAGTTATFNPASVTTSGASTIALQTSTSTPPGTFYLTVLAKSGSLTRAMPIALTVSASSPLSGNGTDADVGSPSIAGSWNSANGVHTIRGSGSDIWHASDQFNFNYWQATGDVTLTARLLSMTNTNVYAKSGVMIRESLDPSSTYAMALAVPTMLNFGYRSPTGATATSGVFLPAAFPQWLRVVRSGGVFSAYSSSDGVTWIQINTSVPVTMAPNVYVGLAVTSHDVTQTNTSVFDKIVITQP